MAFMRTRKGICDLINKPFAWFIKRISSLHNRSQQLVPSKTLKFLHTAVSEGGKKRQYNVANISKFQFIFLFSHAKSHNILYVHNLNSKISYATLKLIVYCIEHL